MQGRYLADEKGRLYVAHTGRAKSNRVTISLAENGKAWNARLVEAVWSSAPSRPESVILLGAIDDPKLAEVLGSMVCALADLKNQ